MRTRRHPMDYERPPRGKERIYPVALCMTCGGYTLPFRHQAHCAKCGTVALCQVPENRAAEVREEVRKTLKGIPDH